MAWILLGTVGGVRYAAPPSPLPLTIQHDRCTLYFGGVGLGYVLLYSFLPHKVTLLSSPPYSSFNPHFTPPSQELRFLFPVLPLFSLVSAITASHLLPPDSQSLLYPL
ncbi:hypothetical protein EON63_14155, partial [archaeon]